MRLGEVICAECNGTGAEPKIDGCSGVIHGLERMMPHWSQKLPHDACDSAVEWCWRQSSYEEAWEKCELGDWMIWLVRRLAKTDAEVKRSVLCCCACAELSRRYVGKEARRAIDEMLCIVSGWAIYGNATIVDVRTIAMTAGWLRQYRSAVYAARTALSYDAYYGAVQAADCVSTVAEAASDAVLGTSSAGNADVVAGEARAASAAVLRQCADIVRSYYPEPPVLT